MTEENQNNENKNNNSQYPMAAPATSINNINNSATYATISRNPETTEVNIQYIPPINYSVPINLEGEIELTPSMIKAYQYSGSVRCLSIFDIFIGLIYTFRSGWGLLLVIFPMYGYYGSIHYSKVLTRIYLCYQCVNCVFQSLFLIYIINYSEHHYSEQNQENQQRFIDNGTNNMTYDNIDNTDNTDDNINYDSVIMLSILNLFFNCYFFYLIKTFLKSLSKLSENELNNLKLLTFSGNSVTQYRYR